MRMPRCGAIVSDFDGTIAQTFEKSPNGIDISIACDRALETLFQEPGLLRAVGGLKNRAPPELVCDVLALDARLRARGSAYYLANVERLSRLVGPGVQLHPLTDENILAMLAEVFVLLKLEILLGEVGRAGGRTWPHPCDGVAQSLPKIMRRGIPIGIVSSGHDLFIRKCFGLWGIECPRHRVTDDDMRHLAVPLTYKVKPHPLIFEKLRDQMSASGTALCDPIYVGDDIIKDGGLAQSVGVVFGWFSPDVRQPVQQLRDCDFHFSSWTQLESCI